MSVKLTHLVWESMIDDPLEKLVLLAFADYANDEGKCWPGKANLYRKTSMDDRTFDRKVKSLVESGYLQVEIGGGIPCKGGHTNLYRISIINLHLTPVIPTPRQNDVPSLNTRTPVTVTPNPRHSDTQSVREPSIEPSDKKPTRKLAGSIASVILPESLDTEEFRTTLQHWIDHKKLKRDPMTQHAIDLLVKKCAALGQVKAIEAIEYSIDRGWRGVFPQHETHQANGSESKSQFVTRDMIDDWCERKGYSKLAPIARGKLISGKLYGAPITNTQDFKDAMSALLSDWLKSP